MASYNAEIVAKVMRDKGIKSPMTPKDIKRVTREIYRDEGIVSAMRFYRVAKFQETGDDPGLKNTLDLIRESWGPAK